MKKVKTILHTPAPPKKSSGSGNPHMVKTSSMNKNKKRSYKAYRGQGR